MNPFEASSAHTAEYKVLKHDTRTVHENSTREQYTRTVQDYSTYTNTRHEYQTVKAIHTRVLYIVDNQVQQMCGPEEVWIIALQWWVSLYIWVIFVYML